MDTISDTCECEDAKYHDGATCGEETQTFRKLPDGSKVALCFDCSSSKHNVTGE